MRYTIPLVRWIFSIPACGYAGPVTVPHTWNIDDPVMNHRGAAEYEAAVFAEPTLQGSRAFLSFGAVCHTAEATVNGRPAGGHMAPPTFTATKSRPISCCRGCKEHEHGYWRGDDYGQQGRARDVPPGMI